MLIKKNNSSGICSPLMSGLIPLLAFIVGAALCATTHKLNNHVLDEDDWVCSKFDNGVCVRYEPTITPAKGDKQMKNNA